MREPGLDGGGARAAGPGRGERGRLTSEVGPEADVVAVQQPVHRLLHVGHVAGLVGAAGRSTAGLREAAGGPCARSPPPLTCAPRTPRPAPAAPAASAGPAGRRASPPSSRPRQLPCHRRLAGGRAAGCKLERSGAPSPASPTHARSPPPPRCPSWGPPARRGWVLAAEQRARRGSPSGHHAWSRTPGGRGGGRGGLRGQPQREGAGRAVLWGAHGDAKVTREVTQECRCIRRELHGRVMRRLRPFVRAGVVVTHLSVPLLCDTCHWSGPLKYQEWHMQSVATHLELIFFSQSLLSCVFFFF